MKHRELSIVYNYREPLKKLDKNPLLVLIHGYGSDENDLFSFSSQLPPEFHIVSIRGINKLPFGGYSWYDINFVTGSSEKFVDEQQGIESRDKIREFIEIISDKYNCQRDNIFIMGFSQGAILSYAISLSYPELAKNIIPMSGYLHREMVNFQNKEKYSHLNFLITNGSLDEIIPIEWSRKTVDILKEKDIYYDYKEYLMVHTISPQSFFDIKDWILERLNN